MNEFRISHRYSVLLTAAFILTFLSINKGHAQNVKELDLFVSGTEGVQEFRIPSMITTKSGTVLAVCDARVDRKGDVPNNIDQVIKRSLDSGKTWDKIRTIVDFPNQEGAADPQLLQDRETGRIFLFYAYCPGRNEVTEGANRNRRHLGLQYVYSDDDSENWSLPIVAEYGLKQEGWHSIWSAPGRGLQLQSGRLIAPVTVSDTAHMYSYYLYSDDHGNSWQMSNLMGTDINEPTMVELDDHTLLLNARNRTGNRALVSSTDGGDHWSEVSYHEDLIEPGCQGSFIKYTVEGKSILVFSNPADSKKRSNMTVSVSNDNGETWPVKKVIYEGPSAYSCLTILPNGKIGLLYENGKESPYEKISFTSLDVSWFLDRLKQ